jgi:predicted nucleotidyltransferase
MATIHLPKDFKEFLKLLNANQVEYLLIGGYAVGYHGYPRATADMDIWIAIKPENSTRLINVFNEFGFSDSVLKSDIFLKEDQIIRIGLPPIRIEVVTTISGVSFDECYSERVIDKIDGIKVNLIDLKHLKINKKASGRHKDLNDLENLP